MLIFQAEYENYYAAGSPLKCPSIFIECDNIKYFELIDSHGTCYIGKISKM